MAKKKLSSIICTFIALAVIAVIGVKFLTGNSSEEAPTAEETTTAPAYETLVPFAQAQTEILTPTTVKPHYEFTTRYDENASRLSQQKGWRSNDLTIGLPEIRTGSVSTVEYESDKGRRTVIRVDTFSYDSYLNYIDRLEAAGFADNNGRAHVPAAAPSTVAMFYSRFDGTRSFGVYWYGAESDAGFNCEIVICDYDQAM